MSERDAAEQLRAAAKHSAIAKAFDFHAEALTLLAQAEEAYSPDGCDHRQDERLHAFSWGEGPRNIWNPYSPTCTKCGRSIGDIMNDLAALYQAIREYAERLGGGA